MESNLTSNIAKELKHILKIKTFVPCNEGLTNSVFIIDTDKGMLVFKANTSRYGPWKVKKEVDILSKLRGIVPVPEVIYCAPTTSLFPRGYLIMTSCEGESAKKNIKDLPNNFFECTAIASGNMHTKTYDAYGFLSSFDQVTVDLRNLGGFQGPYKNAFEQLFSCIIVWYEHLKSKSSRFVPKLEILFKRMQDSEKFFNDNTPRFLHGDYSLKNLRQQNGTLTGVLDFEFAMSGDPSWDIHHFLMKAVDDGASNESIQQFTKTYDCAFGLPQYFFEKREFMRYHSAFRKIIVLNSLFVGKSTEEQEQIKSQINSSLERLVDGTDPYLDLGRCTA